MPREKGPKRGILTLRGSEGRIRPAHAVILFARATNTTSNTPIMGLNYSMSTTDSSTLKGIIGETIALHYLYRNKYEILQKNFNCRYGEVDIIAIRGSTIHFVEVKAWSAFGYENVAYAVNERRKRRMIQTAIFFLQQFPKFAGHALMFSLLFIDMSSLTCRYIEAAFEEEEW